MEIAYMKNGKWLKPDRKTLVKYFAIVFLGLVINFGLKALLYNATSQRTPLFLGVNLESKFHEISNPLAFDILASVLSTTWLFFLPLFFRYSQRWFDEWWLMASALMFAALLGGIFERISTGGVRYIFSLTNGLRYLCIGRGIRFESYYWNPDDFYSSIYVYSLIIILFVSYFQQILRSGQHDANQKNAG
jgi:hypothetical protein